MYVHYDCELWKVKNAPVRESLMYDLKISCPHMQLTLVNASNNRREKVVSISEVSFQFEH